MTKGREGYHLFNRFQCGGNNNDDSDVKRIRGILQTIFSASRKKDKKEKKNLGTADFKTRERVGMSKNGRIEMHQKAEGGERYLLESQNIHESKEEKRKLKVTTKGLHAIMKKTEQPIKKTIRYPFEHTKLL
ncbi:hypothetical protein TWF569_000564 [Orbilia oligospora]|nr:hypothetical protein TWF569_000564 [Orbilia oligospora]